MFKEAFINTTSITQVHFIISGEQDETDVRILEDDKRPILTRSGIDSFLMAVPRYFLTHYDHMNSCIISYVTKHLENQHIFVCA